MTSEKEQRLWPRGWRRLPYREGWHWFAASFEKRLNARPVLVRFDMISGNSLRMVATDGPEITQDSGWWMPIVDDRVFGNRYGE